MAEKKTKAPGEQIERRRRSAPRREGGGEVILSAPWGGANVVSQCYLGDEEGMETFVKQRTRAHALHIREEAKTRRLSLWLAFGLLVLAVLVPLFAPAGRETLSYWIGAALFIFACGAAGYSRAKVKSKPISIEVDRG